MSEFLQPSSQEYIKPEQGKFSFDSNPIHYLQLFENSKIFNQRFDEYFQECIDRNPQITKEKAMETFLSLPRCGQALWQYFIDDCRLTYNADNYSSEDNNNLNNYWSKVRQIRTRERLQRLDPDDLTNLDWERRMAHTKAANQLVEEGFAPNINFGRMFVHFLTIDQGLDNIDTSSPKKNIESYKRGAFL